MQQNNLFVFLKCAETDKCTHSDNGLVGKNMIQFHNLFLFTGMWLMQIRSMKMYTFFLKKYVFLNTAGTNCLQNILQTINWHNLLQK